MVQVRKPPVPQAGSRIFSPSLGFDHVHHELGDGARGVVFARVAGVLQVAQQLLVDVAEQVAVGGGIEIDFVDFVDDLSQQRAGLHVVVGILKRRAQHGSAAGGGGQVFEVAEQVVVDEVGQLIAGHAFGIRRPVAPAEARGQR